jgi:hypothetical protein
MKVYKITANILHQEQHFPIEFSCKGIGLGDALEWHESLDLMLLKYNNIQITEQTETNIFECFLFMADIPKKQYKKYRKEYDLEGYSQIAENYIDYNWDIVTSKKIKHGHIRKQNELQ